MDDNNSTVMLTSSQIKILTCLRQNARVSLAKIGREQHIATSTVYDQLRELERTYVTRYVSLINHHRVGKPFRTFIYCLDENETIKVLLSEYKGTNAVYKLREGVAADILFASVAEENEFLEELQSKKPSWVSTHRVIEPLAEETWLPQNNSGDDNKVSGNR